MATNIFANGVTLNKKGVGTFCGNVAILHCGSFGCIACQCVLVEVLLVVRQLHKLCSNQIFFKHLHSTSVWLIHFEMLSEEDIISLSRYSSLAD